MANRKFQMSIGGELKTSPSTFDVLNPANGEIIAQCPEATEEDLNNAVSAAQSAFKSWSVTPVDERRKVLLGIAQLIKKNAKELATVLTLEQGKPMKQAMGEVLSAAYWASETSKCPFPAQEVLQDDDKVTRIVSYHPLGVVACITPWNFPISLCIFKLAPALLTGNCVVIKGSEHTPLTTLMIGELITNSKIVPPGVVNVLGGAGSIGARMCTHPGIAKVSFTGSVPTGMAIQRSAADSLKRSTLELGGNDAALVLNDVPVAKVAKKVFGAAFANSGQVCSAIKRVYVPDSIYEEFVNTISHIAKNVKVGDGADPKVDLGPLNNAQQLRIVEDLVQDAKQRGATVNAGGHRVGDSKGYGYAPTIVSNVDDTFRIVNEEQFGPVLPILKYSSLDDAIERVNHSNFGLGASVWGSTIDKATDVASKLDAGTVWVNQHLVLLPDAPFGGRKWSGIGRENGKWGIMSFLEPKCTNIAKL